MEEERRGKQSREKEKEKQVRESDQSKAINTELKSRHEKEYLGVMVYIAGHKNRQDALKTSAKLSAQGIREFIIVNDPDKANILSLGVFGLKKNAERRVNQLKKLKYTAKTDARYRERTIFWLYYPQSNESDLQP